MICHLLYANRVIRVIHVLLMITTDGLDFHSRPSNASECLGVCERHITATSHAYGRQLMPTDAN